MNVLVTVASRHGATNELGERIASALAQRGLDAQCRPVDEVHTLGGYDAVVLGSAVYMGKWLGAARGLVSRHARELTGVPVWLFSSGPIGPSDHPIPDGDPDPTDIARTIELTHARGHRTFGGRLERARLNFAERAAVKALHAPDGDYRDWSEVDSFAEEIAAALLGAELPAA